MFAVGHIALGYIIGRVLNRATGESQNLPALWTMSLLPDIDLLIPGLEHRGPTHSIIIALLIFIPLLVMMPKKTAPLFAALATHSLIGDYITNGGVKLLWPISTEVMKYESTIIMGTKLETYLELAMFTMLILTLIISKDYKSLFDSDRRNILFLIPLSTIVLPIMFKYPVVIPEILIIPHLALLSLIAVSFTMALITTASKVPKKKKRIPLSENKRNPNDVENEELIEKMEQLEQQKEKLQKELRKLKRKPEGKIGYLLLTLGLALIALAVYYEHNVSAFIGIALTFWGALLLYIRPTQFIRKEILDSTLIEPTKYIHALLNELEFKGTPVYISPRTLSGLRSATIYIPKSEKPHTPTDEELSKEEAFMRNPQAIKLTPPGLGLSRLLEEELKTNFSTVDLEYLQYNLEKALVEGLEITEAFEMEASESTIMVEVRGSIFDDILEELEELEAPRRIGDPLTSAIACILARTTRHPITIEKVEKEPRKKLTKIIYKMENSTSEKEINDARENE